MIPLPPVVLVALGFVAVAAYKYFVKGETDAPVVPDVRKNVPKHRDRDPDRKQDSRDSKSDRRSTRLAVARKKRNTDLSDRLSKLEQANDEIHTKYAGIHQLRNDRPGDDLPGEQLPDPKKSGKTERDVATPPATPKTE